MEQHMCYSSRLVFIARLTALAPKPRVNLTRFHGVMAPSSQLRELVTPAYRGKGVDKQIELDVQEKKSFTRKAGNDLGATSEAGIQYRYRSL